jgi:hypothetical protein
VGILSGTESQLMNGRVPGRMYSLYPKTRVRRVKIPKEIVARIKPINAIFISARYHAESKGGTHPMPNVGHGFTTSSHSTPTGLQEKGNNIRPNE